MAKAEAKGFNLIKIQQVRLWLQVSTISDIGTVDGKRWIHIGIRVDSELAH